MRSIRAVYYRLGNYYVHDILVNTAYINDLELPNNISYLELFNAISDPSSTDIETTLCNLHRSLKMHCRLVLQLLLTKHIQLHKTIVEDLFQINNSFSFYPKANLHYRKNKVSK